ncbi:hypothetical protein LUZ61_019256 [Rhynchospora tenuis]|uniref:aldehyde oxygenase (deformylating) n=1 Tax=Rhynchospora tenuis TaxID=198213 RepID=A0AAD6EMP8_9POAL|nr:hypothetical protein LUZ61_019256 [Rhynchospora tenuis]
MASNPGLLTEWPWHRLGNFKYVVVAPWVVHGFYELAIKGWHEVDIGYLLVFPAMLFRVLHNQIWISLSRFQNARSKHRIVDKSLDFEQVDRERNWDDQIIFNAILIYLGHTYLEAGRYLPWWSTDGAIVMALLHIGPVEFLYYWFHRALHHHFLYSRYHSHHHASIVTEPITSVIHPFAEHIVYFSLFAIPLLGSLFTGTASILTYFFYITYIDFMNNMGHCNFELVPTWLFRAFPPLKYLMYTPSFHSLHHTQFRTNYCLFMPFYDYVYNTMDKSSDDLYEKSLKGKEETIDVVHLTHPTTLQSIFHFRLGFAAFASNPCHSTWYMIVMSPLYWISMMVTWLYGSTFTVERNTMIDLKMQTWAIPRYTFQYNLGWEKEAINDLIEKAILDADKRGIKVVSLGLLNQAKELNGSGELYLQKHPNLKVKIVDGSSLVAALVIKSIPKEVEQVLLTGSLSKVASAIATSLCQRGIQVIMNQKQEYHMLKPQLSEDIASNLLFSRTSTPEVWLVGDGFEDREQSARKGTKFIPYSQFPLRKTRKNCTYYTTPAMKIPKTLENMHSCENWLPRRVISAWRVAGIVHALEGWDMHECGDTVLDMEKILSAAIRHGFVPLQQA